MLNKKICPEGKILNPKTNRCIKINKKNKNDKNDKNNKNDKNDKNLLKNYFILL